MCDDLILFFLTEAVILKVLETTNCTWSGTTLLCNSQGFRTVPVGIPNTTRSL